MTLQEFNRDIIPIIQVCIGLAGLASFFLMWWQLRQTTIWNKLNSPYNFGDTQLSERLEVQLYIQAKKIGINTKQDTPLLSEEVTKIFNDDDTFFALKAFLNDFESLGAAISVGFADSDLAYAVHAARLRRAYQVFKPYIDQYRSIYDSNDIWLELEKVALAWETKHIKSQNIQQKHLSDLKAKLQKINGVQPKV